MAKAASVKRYAQALFAIASEKGNAEQWLPEMRGLVDALADSTVNAYMTSPRVTLEDKLEVVAQLTKGFDPMITNLVCLLTSRNGISLIGPVTEFYSELLNIYLGRVRADVTTAIPISAAQHSHLSESLGVSLQKYVVLETSEDPEIIGGVLIRVGDQILDGSVKSKLGHLGEKLANESLK